MIKPMMHAMRTYYLLLILLFFNNSTYGQNNFDRNFSIMPAISLGYTIGVGITYGIETEIGLFESKFYGKHPIYTGISISYNWHNFKQEGIHKILLVNLMMESDVAKVKIGQGRIIYISGYKGRNKDTALGISTDLSFTTQSTHTPWIGYRKFSYHKVNWRWHDRPYRSFYSYFANDKLFFEIAPEKLSPNYKNR